MSACSPGKTTMQWQPSTGTIGVPAKQNPLPDFDPVPLVSYRRQWLLFGLFLSLAGWYYLQRPGVSVLGPTLPAQVAPDQAVDWYFILHLPEAPAEPAAQAQLRQRVIDWLTVLRQAGFRPVRL